MLAAGQAMGGRWALEAKQVLAAIASCGVAARRVAAGWRYARGRRWRRGRGEGGRVKNG